MYDEALLKELTELENTVRFDSFDFNDAYALGSALRAAGEKAPKPIAVRIVLDGMILYQSFLPGTDATNNNWMDKKQRTVQLTGTTSLRAAVERELYGAKAPWQHDEEHYAFCGGGFPLYVNGEFRGAAIISGLPHLKDHALLCETVKAYWESKKKQFLIGFLRPAGDTTMRCPPFLTASSRYAYSFCHKKGRPWIRCHEKRTSPHGGDARKATY